MATAVHSCWISRRAISPTSLWESRTEGSVEVRAAQVEAAALALHLAAAVFQSCAARRTVVGRVGSLHFFFLYCSGHTLLFVVHPSHFRATSLICGAICASASEPAEAAAPLT